MSGCRHSYYRNALRFGEIIIYTTTKKVYIYIENISKKTRAMRVFHYNLIGHRLSYPAHDYSMWKRANVFKHPALPPQANVDLGQCSSTKVAHLERLTFRLISINTTQHYGPCKVVIVSMNGPWMAAVGRMNLRRRLMKQHDLGTRVAHLHFIERLTFQLTDHQTTAHMRKIDDPRLTRNIKDKLHTNTPAR